MFGAYQAGAWKALAGRFQPDVVIGASAGALNAWAIAGGASPLDLAARWLAPENHSLTSGRVLRTSIRELWERYKPRVEVGIVATGLPAFRPRLFRNAEIDWRHLAASAAVPFWYWPVRLDGRWHTDGGLLGPLHLWAAAIMRASRVLAINVLAEPPSRVAGAFMRLFRALAPRLPATPADLEVHVLTPSRPLGSLRDAMLWRRAAVEDWVRLGEDDAARFPW